MTNITDNDTREGTDEDTLNPHNRRELAQSIARHENQAAQNSGFRDKSETTDPSTENQNIAQAGEQAGSGNTVNNWNGINSNRGDNFTNNWTGSKSNQGFGNKLKTVGKIIMKKKGATIGIGGLVGVGGLMSFFTSATAPIGVLFNLVDDLDDQVSSLQMRDSARGRLLTKTARAETISGCTKLSIMCRFKSVSSTELARMNRAGIEVDPSSKKVLGRTIPKNYIFRGKTYSPAEWNTALKTRGVEYKAQIRANNMKFLAFHNRPFYAKFMARFGLTKKAPGLSGTIDDRINQLLTAGRVTSIDGLTWRNAVDPDGNPDLDANGTQKRTLVNSNGDVVGTYTADEARRIQTDFDKISTSGTRTPSPKLGSLIGAASVLGYWDLACSINNMIGIATVTAKISAKNDLIQYAWGVASNIQKIQAGEGTPEDAEAIGRFFMDTDTRREVIDAVQTANASTGSADSDDVYRQNPNYGKSAVDSELINMSINGGVAPITETQKQYTVGFGLTTLLWGLDSVSNILDTVTNVGSAGMCDFVQNWFVRGAGIAISVVAAFASGGSITGAQVALTGALIVGMVIIQNIVSKAAAGSIIDSLKDESATVERGDAFWTGIAETQSTAAQVTGMKPGTVDEIVAYKNNQIKIHNDYLAMEAENASPFDITKEGTFLGSIVSSYRRNIGNGVSLANILSVPDVITSNVLFPTASAAGGIDPARYQRCDDRDLEQLGIDADVQCNIRYVMPDSDLALETDEVAQWMEDNEFVAEDTETGLPEGYTPPNSREQQNALVGFIKGATVGQFVSTINLPNDYARFLEYCAYRTAPFGETFEETGLLGGASEEWTTGSKCTEDSTQMSYFRVYTMDVTLMSGLDEEGFDAPTTAAEGTVSESPVVVSDGAWSKPNAAGFNRVSQSFGNPVSYNSGYPIGNGRYGHNGVDLSGSRQSERVYAACSGTTTTSISGEYTTASTNTIVINCGSGITVGYHHSVLTAGSTVTAGQDIGYTDLSGNTTGHHVHLTVKVNGVFVNPITFFGDRGITLP